MQVQVLSTTLYTSVAQWIEQGPSKALVARSSRVGSTYIGCWCNGNMTVSKTVAKGSIPLLPVKYVAIILIGKEPSWKGGSSRIKPMFEFKSQWRRL